MEKGARSRDSDDYVENVDDSHEYCQRPSFQSRSRLRLQHSQVEDDKPLFGGREFYENVEVKYHSMVWQKGQNDYRSGLFHLQYEKI